MRHPIWPSLTLVLIGLFAPAGHAHYNMLLPDRASANRGQEVSIVYQWGHPFEHQLFETRAPQRLSVIAPDGKKTDLTNKLAKIKVAGPRGKKVTAYRLNFTPGQYGDFLLVLSTPPLWMADEKVFFQDTVKVVLHVQTQEGWDRSGGQEFELLPLTRPYGLQPGMVFQAQAVAGGKPVARTLIEIERYNPTPPKTLPADEQMTRAVKTDPNGVATGTLTEAGWWCLTARRDAGKRKQAGKSYRVWQRTTLWVFVDEKIKSGASR